MLDGEVTVDAARAVLDLLQTQLDQLVGVHKALAADIMDARSSAPVALRRLQGLTPRVRSVQARLAQETKRTKEVLEQAQKDSARQQKEAALEESQAQQEQQDSRKLEAALPKVMEASNMAEERLEAVLAAAEPLNQKVADGEMEEKVTAALSSTEDEVKKAQAAVKNARALLGKQLAAAKKFAPAAKKLATNEYGTLEEKLKELEQKLRPYLNIRKDYTQKRETRQQFAELTEILETAESDLDSVSSSLEGKSEFSDELLKSTDASFSSIAGRLAGLHRSLEQRLQSATPDSAVHKELSQLRVRGRRCKERLEDLRAKLRAGLEGVRFQGMLHAALERIEAAEDMLLVTVKAEEPFQNRIEDMTPEEASAAAVACREAAQSGESKVNHARTFLQARIADIAAGRCPEANRSLATAELEQLQNRVEVVTQKLAAFRRNVSQQEASVLLRDVVGKVAEAELLVQATMKSGAPLVAVSKAADVAGGKDVPVDQKDPGKLEEIMKEMLSAEKSASLACAETRKLLSAKMRDAKSRQKELPAFIGGLSDLQGRLNEAQQTLAKQRKEALQGEKLWKVQLILDKIEDRMQKVEQQFEEAEALTTPLGDEAAITVQTVDEMEAAVTGAKTSLDELYTAVEVAQERRSKPSSTDTGAPKDDKIDGLQPRLDDCKEKLVEMQLYVKEQRQRLQCEDLLQQAQEKKRKVDEVLTQMTQAEAPYLSGADGGAELLGACDAAATAVQNALVDARSCVATKLLEIQPLVEPVAKYGQQELEVLSRSFVEAAQRLSKFRSDTDDRRAAALQQEAIEKVTKAEESVRSAALATKTFADLNLDSAEAKEACDRFGTASDAALAAIEVSRRFLVERMRDKKSKIDKTEVVKLSARLDAAKQELSQAQVAAKEHEQRVTAHMLLKEGKELLPNLEAAVSDAKEAAAPLLEEGGQTFITAAWIRQTMEAFAEHLKNTKLSRDEFFEKQFAAKEVDRPAFYSFLSQLPELSFTELQQSAMFSQADEDKDGKLSKQEFFQMARENYVCVHKVSMTDKFEIDGSETVLTLEADDMVEALEEPRAQATLGILRIFARSAEKGTEGWITLQGNQGSTFLRPLTPYSIFMKGLEAKLGQAQDMLAKTKGFVSKNNSLLTVCNDGPMAELRTVIDNLGPETKTLQAQLEKLQQSVASSHQDHRRREDQERKKQAEKKERQAVDLALQLGAAKASEVVEAMQSLEAASAPLLKVLEGEGTATSELPPESTDSPPGSSVDTIREPLALREAITTASTLALEAAKAAEAALKEPYAKASKPVGKSTGGPWQECRAQLASHLHTAKAATKRVGEILDSVDAACKALATDIQGQVLEAVKTSMREKGQTLETLFKELLGRAGGAEGVPESVLKSYLGLLPGLNFSSEQLELLFRTSMDEGKPEATLNYRSFCDLLERYCKCIKDIAMTSILDIKSAKTLRKIGAGEIIEVLEGPKTVDGLARVRARALQDNLEGWVALRGSMGSVYFENVPKPHFFVASAAVAAAQAVGVGSFALEDSFDNSTKIRDLGAGEVLEVLEGPRREAPASVQRAKVKVSDGAVGWITFVGRNNEATCELKSTTYKCTASIAVTDIADMKDSHVRRKLEVGEGIVMLEGPIVDETTGVTRIRARAMRDDLEGWVTLKGNAGTVYAEESGKQYTMQKEGALHKGFRSISGSLRLLKQGEEVTLLEGPREEKIEPSTRMRCRALADDAVGWVTLRNEGLQPWMPRYRCTGSSTRLEGSQGTEGASLVRLLELGEVIEVLEGPRLEKSTGFLRIRGKSTKDEAVGWASIRGADGKALLECMAAAKK
eukprot:TRINITY_DN57073_c0_g1_i1.p1 TRINITY_DN57073_c0_g1~~TRINITY_DN57073_c0_g1_i1.p1  ORF type:complete len:2024 (+),score=506.13 TRINITY_DN57073_c0_g1_i1:617-6073(+)